MKKKYNDYDRKKAIRAKLENALNHRVDYPVVKRRVGKEIRIINGQCLEIYLVPAGQCTQYKCLISGEVWMKDGKAVVAGKSRIDKEIRRRMPPMTSEYSL